MLNLSLIWELTKRDFTEQFAGSALGMTWAVICPVINLVIYPIVFGQVMGCPLAGEFRGLCLRRLCHGRPCAVDRIPKLPFPFHLGFSGQEADHIKSEDLVARPSHIYISL